MNYTGRLLPGWQSNPLWKKITSVILMPMKTAQNRREQEKTGGAAHNRRTCIPSPWQSRGPWTWSAARGIGKSPWWRSTAGKEVSPAELRFPMPHLSESDTNSKSSEKNLPTLKQLVQDNNEENIIDKMNTERRGQSSQEGDDASSWQSSNLKPNQCMVQGATDCVIREPLQKNYLKPKAKDQSEMTQNEGKIQKAETFGKSFSKRPLRSLMQTLDRPSVGKSPRPRTTESRYLGTLKVLDTKSSRSATFNLETADTIRASIYQVWVEKKKQICHEEQKKQKLKVQQENERREQEKSESKKEAMASFEAWKAKKKGVLKETYRKKKEEERKKHEAEEDNKQQKAVAKKAFEKWKEEKDICLTEMLKKQEEIEKEKKKKEKEQVTEKKKENVAALINWKTKKELALRQKVKEHAKKEQEKKTEEEYTKYEREDMASTMYEKWLEQKEKQEKRDKKQRKMKCILQHDEPPPPWSPPNKTIPFGK
ncbi:microtubule-associated protein 9 isoform X2 [Scyliorhinus canicula]|uniref:microtubule-associated protein 9 isoform X2 n=1 Tax=Scyliorhinus canicula TaxID=7830 RepID=UPI0018F6A09B|nr:microtubule-associated protein 9 isoform X2 [Scyliorhinus canicula]